MTPPLQTPGRLLAPPARRLSRDPTPAESSREDRARQGGQPSPCARGREGRAAPARVAGRAVQPLRAAAGRGARPLRVRRGGAPGPVRSKEEVPHRGFQCAVE